MNIDAQALEWLRVQVNVQCGSKLTIGLGSGCDPVMSKQAVQGISELILTPGLINLDFSDIKAAISGMGMALIGNATAKGPNAAVEAAKAAINSPLLEDTKIRGARQVLMNITASPDIGLHEMNEACSIIREATASDDLQLNFGVIAKESMGDSVKVTIIATGFVKVEEARETAIE